MLFVKHMSVMYPSELVCPDIKNPDVFAGSDRAVTFKVLLWCFLCNVISMLPCAATNWL